jgi:proline-specific peptidase
MVGIDDTSLFVETRGQGEPLIVLHGGPGLDHHEFGDYLDPLTDAFRLLLVDMRSCGGSEATPPSTWTLERHAQDVVMLARALRLARYAVLGHSYGAFVALQSAVDFPGMASRTIISSGIPSMRFLGPFVEANLAAFEPASMRRQVAESWASEPHVNSEQEFARLMADQLPFHFADPLDPRIADYLARTHDTVYAPDVLRHASAGGYGEIEVEDRLGSVSSPTLVLAGSHDRTCSLEAARAIAAGIPAAELVVFERSGHMAFVEEQEAYLAAVRGFLRRT